MTEKTDSRLLPPFVHSDAPAPVNPPAEETKSSGWSKQEWSAFDWKSAASLRAPEKVGGRAEREWEATEWDDPAKPVPAK